MATNLFKTLISGIDTLVQAISTSAGASDGNKIIATDATGKIDTSLLPTGIGPDTVSIVASATLAAGDFVNIHDNGGTANVRLADASNNRPAHGFVLSAVTATNSATVYLQGANNQLSGLTIGARYYLSNSVAGDVSLTSPDGGDSGHLSQYLGVAINATTINFEDNGYVAIA